MRQIGLKFVHHSCVTKFIDSAVLKAQKKRDKSKEDLKDYQKTLKKKKLLETTQRYFNKFIRLRDTNGVGCNCISCGGYVRYGTKNCQAGHYKPIGTRNDLRFNEDNCHVQCLFCNHYSSGDKWVVYKENLVKKIGQDRVDMLEVREKQDFSKKGLEKIRVKYLKKIKKYST
jgi:hypothetical protein